MRRKVKNIIKIFGITILILFCLLLISYGLVRHEKVQTFLVHKITNEVSEQLNTKFTIESVEIRFFNRLILNNIYLEDHKKDTLLYADRLTAKLRSLNREDKKIRLQKIEFDNASIRLYKDSTGFLNINHITKQLKREQKEEKQKEKWTIYCNNLALHESDFSYKIFHKKKSDFGINFTDLHIKNINLKSNFFRLQNDTVKILVKDLSCQEKSGLKVDHMNCLLSLNSQHMHFNNVSILTKRSKILAHHVNFNFENFIAFSKDAKNKLKMQCDFENTLISLADIAYFAPVLRNFPLRAKLSGDFKGKISDFKAKNVEIEYLYNTKIIGNFNMIGLPDIKETFIFVDLKQLTTIPSELEKLLAQMPLKKKVTLSENLEKLGKISYSGNFTGFPEDFVAYGNLFTNLGIVSTDLSIKPGTENEIEYNGLIKTTDFDIGTLMNNDSLVGTISMNASIEGWQSKNGIKGFMDGKIQKIELNNYEYQNIDLKGNLSEKTFDGAIIIEDPNIKFSFLGNFDFSGEIPEFNFITNIPYANLYELNIVENDSTMKLSTIIEADFIGTKLDDLNGKISLLNTHFVKNSDSTFIHNIHITADSAAGIKTLALSSDFVDGKLKGEYHFSNLINSSKTLIYNYLPTLRGKNTALEKSVVNNFSFWINIKKTGIITDFFLPSLKISEYTQITGRYYDKTNSFEGALIAEGISVNDNKFENVIISLNSNDTVFTMATENEKLVFSNGKNLQNLTTISEIKNNNMTFSMHWDNYSTPSYSGSFLASAELFKPEHYNHPIVNVNVLPAKFVFEDSVWNIRQSDIIIDSSFVWFDNFKINSKNQSFGLYGALSENPFDTLFFSFNNFNTEIFNEFIKNKNLKIKGNLSGDAELSSLYTNRLFYSDLFIEDFKINEKSIGYTTINSNWDSKKNKIHLDVSSKRGKLNTLNISGDYTPSNKAIDFYVSLDKLYLDLFNPFIKDIATIHFPSMVSGIVRLSGTTSQPLANGELNFFKTDFSINYLNTRYSFTDKFYITNNQITANNIKITDRNGRSGNLNTQINNRYFKDFTFVVNLNTDMLRFLNTGPIQNEYFYGNANASAAVKIQGDKDNIRMNISAKTEKNTAVNIPLNSGAQAKTSDFIVIKGTEKTSEENIIPEKYQVNQNGLIMSFDLEITPEAEIQLIFDSQLGDIIKAKGNGNIKTEINNKGKFLMFGNYIIEEGDYLFTLQNVINKKFTIREGSSITWSGDPANATVDILAIYKTKANIENLSFDLKGEQSQRVLVECHIKMEGSLDNPNPKFDLYLPNADEETRSILKNATNTEEELTNQFLALLIINDFMENSNTGSGGSAKTNVAGVTASELLSNQLSHMLSKISEDIDIGVNYRLGDEITTDEIEVAMSTQLFNDRVIVNGNVDVGGTQSQQKNTATTSSTSNIVGDFIVEFKLNKKGNIRLKAYNRANNNTLFEEAPYTQGVGIFYKKEFNHLFKPENNNKKD